MPLTNNAKHAMLSQLATLMTHTSLHSSFPGATGVNELTGGAYARQPTAYSAPASGEMTLSGPELFDVPAGATVQWIGGWSALTAGTFYGYAPNGSTGVLEFMADVATDFVTAPAHGFANNDQIVFYGGTPPGGLTEGTVYFARNITADTFQVALTSGGVAINLTSVGSALCVVSKIVTETFAAAGQVNVTTFTHSMNLG
jgi:hypothetical protein